MTNINNTENQDMSSLVNRQRIAFFVEGNNSDIDVNAVDNAMHEFFREQAVASQAAISPGGHMVMDRTPVGQGEEKAFVNSDGTIKVWWENVTDEKKLNGPEMRTLADNALKEMKALRRKLV